MSWTNQYDLPVSVPVDPQVQDPPPAGGSSSLAGGQSGASNTHNGGDGSGLDDGLGLGGSTKDADGKPKKKRARMVMSCTVCVRRKSKCDQVIPCSACVKRGKPGDCKIEAILENPPVQPFALNDELVALRDRVATLEGLVASLLAAGASGASFDLSNLVDNSSSSASNGIPVQSSNVVGGEQPVPSGNGTRSSKGKGGMKKKNPPSDEQNIAAVLSMLGTGTDQLVDDA
ncbi:hypothetical protein T439DRAFT_329281 [Meredithblackwellia eburnea MCA 4105]